MKQIINLGDIIDEQKDPAKIALIDLGQKPHRTCTYGELDRLADAVARGLSRKFATGTKIAISAVNSSDFWQRILASCAPA